MGKIKRPTSGPCNMKFQNTRDKKIQQISKEERNRPHTEIQESEWLWLSHSNRRSWKTAVEYLEIPRENILFIHLTNEITNTD